MCVGELAGCVLSQFVLMFVMQTNGFFLYMILQVFVTLRKQGFVKVIFEEMHTTNGISTIIFVNDSFQIHDRRGIKRVHGHGITLNVSFSAHV